MATEPSERWQLKLLPMMRAALVLLAVFFFAASLFQYQQVYRDIGLNPQDKPEAAEQRPSAGDAPSSAPARFQTMVGLERDVVALRYRQANAVLLLRTWTRYTGFLVGMVLALAGAFFILGRLREDSTHFAAEGGGAKLDLTTQSPGIILAILGTVLMLVTIWVKFDVTMIEKPVYVLPWGLEQSASGDRSGGAHQQTAATPPFTELPPNAAAITPSRDSDRPVPPGRTPASPVTR